MDFRELNKFIKTMGKEYNIPAYSISVYYNHRNVYYGKKGNATFLDKIKGLGKNLYFMHSGAKLICCVALMKLIQSYKLTLNDNVKDYIDFDCDIKIRDFIQKFSTTEDFEDERFNFKNITLIIEKLSKKNFNDYVYEIIFKPLKMKNTSFILNDKNKKHIALQYLYDGNKKSFISSDKDIEEIYNKNNGCLITTVADYSIFCDALCAGGKAYNGYQLLSEESTNLLINELMNNETEKNDAYVCVGYNGGLILIDIKKRITIVYAQHVHNLTVQQLEMYPKLRKIVYEGIGVDTWSKGYNLFP